MYRSPRVWGIRGRKEAKMCVCKGQMHCEQTEDFGLLCTFTWDHTAPPRPHAGSTLKEKARKPTEAFEGGLAHSGFHCSLQCRCCCFNFSFLWVFCFLRKTLGLFVRWLITQYSLFCLKATSDSFWQTA